MNILLTLKKRILTSKTASHAPLPVVILALSLAACSSESATESDDTGILWEACTDSPTLECGTLEVPVDYNNTEGEKIKLALARLPSTGDARLGHLVMNPGGPGSSGVQLVSDLEMAGGVPAEIREAFHILSFDPRGVAASGSLDCGRELEGQYSYYPVNGEELQESASIAQSISDICYEKYGEYLQHLGSNNVVRDMEEIRQSTGDAELHFLGYSYGTRLASIYLELFPDTTGKLVLDAVNPPDITTSNLVKDKAAERHSIFLNWLSGCVNIAPGCDPQAINQNLTERFKALFSAADSTDPNIAALAAEEGELFFNFALLVTSQPAVGPFLLEAFIDYSDSFDVEILRELKLELDMIAGIDIFGSLEEEVNFAVFAAINCADDPQRPTLDSLNTLHGELNVISDLFAESVIPLAAACNGWPESIDPAPPLSQPSSGRTLIIGGIADDETPLIWSQQLAEATGGTLIVSEHLGHTVAFTGQSSCVDQAITAFLTGDGIGEGETCATDE